MTKIILDTSIIRKYPGILSLNIPATQLYTTQGVVWELRISPNVFNVDLEKEIEETINSGRLIIESVPDRDFSINESRGSDAPLSATDLSIIALAVRFRQENLDDRVMIASTDREIINYKFTHTHGITAIESVGIKNIINDESKANRDNIETRLP